MSYHLLLQPKSTAKDKVSITLQLTYIVDDGRAMDIQLRVTTTTPETSDWSIPITMYCANFPAPAAAPTLIIANINLIQIQWDLPTANGGSSVLGFFLYMKAAADPDYTLVLDVGQNPTVKTYTTTKNALGGVITPGVY